MLTYQIPHQFGSHQMQCHGNLIATGHAGIAVPTHVNAPRRLFDAFLPLVRILAVQQCPTLQTTLRQVCLAVVVTDLLLHTNTQHKNDQIQHNLPSKRRDYITWDVAMITGQNPL